jgi:hypothetical protein
VGTPAVVAALLCGPPLRGILCAGNQSDLRFCNPRWHLRRRSRGDSPARRRGRRRGTDISTWGGIVGAQVSAPRSAPRSRATMVHFGGVAFWSPRLSPFAVSVWSGCCPRDLDRRSRGGRRKSSLGGGSHRSRCCLRPSRYYLAANRKTLTLINSPETQSTAPTLPTSRRAHPDRGSKPHERGLPVR